MESKNLLLYANDIAKLRRIIAARLKAVGKSQNDLSAATGVAGSTMTRWEDESAPNTSTLLKLERQIAAWEREKSRKKKRRAIGYSSLAKSKIEKPNALA